MELSTDVSSPESNRQPADVLQLGSVRFSAKGVAEMDRHRAVVFVPRDEVRGLEAVVSSGAERPLITLLVGLVVLGISLAPVVLFAYVLLFGGTILLSKSLGWIMGLAPIGGWIIHFAIKQRLVLLVHTTQGRTRKVVFQGKPDPAEVRDFLQKAIRYGYQVTHLRAG